MCSLVLIVVLAGYSGIVFVSESHTIITTNGQKREMVSKSTSSFLGADCG
jgi:hypothetical protein